MPILPTDHSIDSLADASVARVHALLLESEHLRTRTDVASRRRFARLFKDPAAIEVTITLTDEVMRIHSLRSSTTIYRRAAAKASVEGFGRFNAVGLKLLAALSHAAPSTVIALVTRRIRRYSRDLILPSEPEALRRHLRRRSRDGIALNINVLGEAVLGDGEAQERLERVLEMIRRPEVNYVSVKLSSVVSQIITIDRDGSLTRVAERLRLLYREANSHGTFVNLDMEEYRDLALTIAAFTSVLSEKEFESLNAGVVLQAYLPESHATLSDLIAWATDRFERTGGTIKVRLVKGANLAMETAESQLHGWAAAPYRSKADVDASYARLIDVALRHEHASAVRIGIASHNLFHLSWALDVAAARGVLGQIDVEMLEGMANAESLTLARTGQKVLLYAPVTRADDFASAVAYLVRRLDENTSDENYLKAAFDIGSDHQRFSEQRDRFLASIAQRHDISSNSLRHAVAAERPSTTFANTANYDTTLPIASADIDRALAVVKSQSDVLLPLVIGGEERTTGDYEIGRDPSGEGVAWYRYCVATTSDIDDAVQVASDARISWSGLSNEERRAVLFRCAEVMENERIATIAVMARDAGKTVAEADPEVSEAIDFARFYSSTTSDFTDSTPVGTVVVVPPWNFPYAIPAGGLFAALAAGNTVILKPAPETVATAFQLVRQLWSGGVSKSVLQFVPTRDDEAGRHLVTHDDVDAVILTGSFDTAVMFTRWKPTINLLAETSGKNSILISACADIEMAVRDVVQSAFGHAGQKCSAASLVIVVRDVYEDPSFLRQLADTVRTLRVGPGWELSTSMGPIIRRAEPALERALTQLEPGERWLVEPTMLDNAGLLWSPGVKLGVAPGSWSHQHEWFGPVLGVMVAPDLTTAIEWQNHTDFGLTAGIQSLDEAECEQWMQEVRAGNLYVNRGITGAVVNRQPFGGWRRSSVGPTAKAGGLNYINCLRTWSPLREPLSAVTQARLWWEATGSQALDRSGLMVERNIQRFQRFEKPIVVRIDDTFGESELTLIDFVHGAAGVCVTYSAASPVSVFGDPTIETVEQLLARTASFDRVRWLSNEPAPTLEFLESGVSVDRRPVAQRGDIEMPRWLLEQSVAITHHRYGNVNAGPKPYCPGLGAP